MRLLGIKIHFDYNSEAKVFARLLAHRGNDYDAVTFYNEWEGHTQGREQFENESRSLVKPFDMGWRSSGSGALSRAEKLVSVGRMLISMRRLVPLVRQHNPDVIYSGQQTWDNLTAAYLAKRLDKPQIVHLHYVPEIIPTTNRFQQNAVENLRKCDGVFTVSEFIQQKVVEYGARPERVFPVMNTISIPQELPESTRDEVRQELGLASETPIIGIVGRVEAWKGQSDTITAFAQIATRFPKAHLLVVGIGDYLEQVSAEAQNSGFEGRIHLLGMRKDVPRLLAAMDIFVHPSRSDPAPLAVLEACAAGLPVVAYAEGGVCEMIIPGETGYLIAPTDRSELAEAIAKLLEDAPKARAMGRANRERMATHFRPEDAGKRFAQLIRTVVDGYRSK